MKNENIAPMNIIVHYYSVCEEILQDRGNPKIVRIYSLQYNLRSELSPLAFVGAPHTP